MWKLFPIRENGHKRDSRTRSNKRRFAILIRVRSEQRSYHSTGAESYYGPNTKFKSFSRFFFTKILQVRDFTKFYRPAVTKTSLHAILDSNSLEELTALRQEYETLGSRNPGPRIRLGQMVPELTSRLQKGNSHDSRVFSSI
jgi:hypothetical protein